MGTADRRKASMTALASVPLEPRIADVPPLRRYQLDEMSTINGKIVNTTCN
jgi:hypothetical protein